MTSTIRPAAALRRVLALLPAVLAVAAAALATAQTASAGEYRVFACQLQDGRPVGLGDWTLSNNNIGNGANECATQGLAYFILGPPQTGTTSWSGVGISLPNGLTATSIRGNRWIKTQGGDGPDHSATPAYQLRYGRTTTWFGADTATRDECRFSGGCTNVAWDDRLNGNFATDLPGGAKWVGLAVACIEEGAPGGACAAGGGGRAHLRVNRLDLTVQDDTKPVVGSPSGSLLQGGPRSGTQSLTFAATDVGAGVYQAILQVDGVEIGRIRPDASATCKDAGSLPEMELEFTRLQPCSNSISVAFDVDTTRITNGTHRITAVVRDAADNLSNVISQDVTTSNVAAPGLEPGSGPDGPSTPNGTGGNLATAILGHKGERKTLRTRFDEKVTLSGKLLDATGTPIVGAAVVVDQQLTSTGSSWTNATVVTTDAKGIYRFVPTTRSSRALRFTYAPVRGATATTTRLLDVDVQARMSIRAASRAVRLRGLIKLSGAVTLDGLPKRGFTVEIQAVVNGRWRTVESRRANGKGAWTYAYRLSTNRRGTLSFRARLRSSGDVPAADSHSAAVKVRVG